MKKQFGIAALLLIPVGATFAFQDQEKKAQPAGASKDDPMMEKMKELGTPGPEHKVLASKIGKWTGKTKTWMEPGGTPTDSTCTIEYRWLLGDRYLQENVKGDFMGMPFEGVGTIGFDKMKKKYVSSWIDNLSTAILSSEGSYDPATKTFTYTGQCPDPMQGKYVASRMVDKQIDNDHWKMEMYSTGPDGKEMKGMEIDYTRAK